MARQTSWFPATLASRFNHRRLIPVALVFCTWLVFSQVFVARFVAWDDKDMLLDNPLLNPPTLANSLTFFQQPTKKLYTPLAYSLWAAVAASQQATSKATSKGSGVFDWPSPLEFHALNLLLHMVAVLMAYLLLRELLNGHRAAAFAGALIFALHPLQVEPVAWVAGMNNLLCGALGLAALWQYLLFAKSVDRPRRHYILATLLFAAALLSKPTAVVIPLIAAAIEICCLKRKLRRVAIALSPWFVMAAIIAFVARLSQPAIGLVAPPFSTRTLVAADAIGFYVTKIFAPFNLTIDYERRPQLIADQIWLCWPGVLIILIASILWLKSRSGTFRASLLIIPAALLPVLGLTPFDFQNYSTVADRYMYLPMFGVALLFACILERIRRHQLIYWTAVVIILVLLAARSADQLRYWHDSLSLTTRQLSYDPDSSTGHKIRAEYLAATGHPESAAPEYRTAIEALLREGKNSDGAVWVDYGNLLRRNGHPADAAVQYQQAIPRLSHDQLAPAYNNWGVALIQIGNPTAAREKFLLALQAQPDYAQAQQNLARLNAQPP